MKVSFIVPTPSLSGGIRVIAIYAELLQQQGHDVTVVGLPRRPSGRKAGLVDLIRSLAGIRPSKPASHLDDHSFQYHLLNRYRPVRDADVPDGDVVIATWWETAEWVSRLDERKGAKFYFLQGYEAFPGQPKDRVDATWQLPLHQITIANWLMRKAESMGLPPPTLIPNGVDLQLFSAPPRGRQSRPTVGFMYSGARFKGSAIIDKAISLIRQELPDLRIVAFGSTPPSPELPIAEGTVFTCRPPQAQIAHIYASVDVWLCGSYTEGFHLPLLEAMACRTPVVTTDIGGAEETIAPGTNGFIVPIGDAVSLAKSALDVLQTSESRWIEMSDAARKTAESFTWYKSAEQFERALALRTTKTPRT